MKNRYIYALGLIGLLALGTFGFIHQVRATPSDFLPTTQSATATTSVTYLYNLTPAGIGAQFGTTTLAFDTFANGSTYKTDMMALDVQFTGSSSLSRLNISPEYSQNGIDWYQDGSVNLSPTTTPMNISNPFYYSWNFASSTVGGNPRSNPNISFRSILLKTPTRYIRAVLSMQPGGANGAVWAQFVPSQQIVH